MSSRTADGLLPDYDYESHHRVRVQATPDIVYPFVRELDMADSRLTRILCRLRGLPVDALSIDGMSRLRFKIVREEPGRHLAIGLIGRFWHPRGPLLDFDPDGFTDYWREGFAKALWSFDLDPVEAGSTLLDTSTRIHCMGERARRRFGRYWMIIKPFSGLIRREILRQIKNRAERADASSPEL